MGNTETTDEIFARVWSLFSSRLEASKSLGIARMRAYRCYDAGDLPPPECDVEVIDRAQRAGVDLSFEHLARFRQAQAISRGKVSHE